MSRSTSSDTRPENDEPRNRETATQTEAKLAIFKFTHVVERRMKPTLDAAITRRDNALYRLAELQQCQNALDVVQLSMKHPSPNMVATHPGEEPVFMEARVNIGEEFYMQAHVFKPQPLVVDVGFGFFVEMSIQEATMFYQRKTDYLQQIVAAQSKQINEVRANLEQVMSNLSNLKSETSTAELLAQLSRLPARN